MTTENFYKLRYESAPALVFIERKLALYAELKKISDELGADSRFRVLDKLVRLLKESRNEIDHYESMLGDTLDVIRLSSICENIRLSIHESYEDKLASKHTMSDFRKNMMVDNICPSASSILPTSLFEQLKTAQEQQQQLAKKSDQHEHFVCRVDSGMSAAIKHRYE